jgi:hypothetical protein
MINRRKIVTTVWLIGLAYILLTHNWNTGIFILIAIIFILRFIPLPGDNKPVIPAPPMPTPRSDEASVEWVEKVEELPAALADEPTAEPKPFHRADLLPNLCPMCGGPIRGNEGRLEWVNATIAKCPFCGNELHTQ